jgi:hypothetical protein
MMLYLAQGQTNRRYKAGVSVESKKAFFPNQSWLSNCGWINES